MFTRKRVTRLLAATTALAATLGLSACGGADADGGSTTLSLVGFAVPKAGNNAAQKEFAKTEDGKGTVWKESYGASGDQSRAVEGGLKADYVHFSITPDVTRLVDAGLVEETWDDGEHKGIVSDSVVVFVVREGNPKNIQSWDDLVKPGVEIVTPNPGSSGSARWNILGAWLHIVGTGGSEADAIEFVTKFFKNIAALPGSGRDATAAFQAGTGDVLISYENEAILARQEGEKIDYVVPDDTLLIENPAAVTKDADPKAQAYLDFVVSPEGQQAFVSKGFRPIDDSVEVGTVEGANDPENPFPAPSKIFTIDDDLDGWEAVKTKFFDENNGIITKIQQETGKS